MNGDGLTRRRFLGAGALAVAAAAAGAACDGGGGGEAATDTSAASRPALTGDVAVAHLVAGLENLAIDTYDALGANVAAGALGALPAVVGAVIATARAQHIEHLTEWNRVLQGAGQPAVDGPDAGLKPTLDGMLAEVADVGGAVRFALLVEEILADTYLKSIPTLTDKGLVRTTALMLATDQQHQALLRYVLGDNPVPEPTQIPDKAAS
ncbi:MAG TPA: ferritin-like domain-containing protein [Acidimicrobiales bacterium]|nr:ferritin-like domain-containing protein [Acidimicrobiales bacterium]